MLAGIVTVSCGHCHPRVTAKIKEQVDTLQHATTIYLHPNMPALAKKLASKMPEGLDVSYFVNSGSEANDLAIQMARLYTGNADVIAFAIRITARRRRAIRLLRTARGSIPSTFRAVCITPSIPDPYRSPYSGTPEEIATKSVADLKDLIRSARQARLPRSSWSRFRELAERRHGAKNYLTRGIRGCARARRALHRG